MYILREMASIVGICTGTHKITLHVRFVCLFGGRVIIFSIM